MGGPDFAGRREANNFSKAFLSWVKGRSELLEGADRRCQCLAPPPVSTPHAPRPSSSVVSSLPHHSLSAPANCQVAVYKPWPARSFGRQSEPCRRLQTQ